MNWLRTTLFRKFHGVKEENQAAANSSNAVSDEIMRTDPHVDAQHERALELLSEATARSRTLKAMDKQNHYSESLTYSMRGTTA
jgi:predicted DNA-binding protein YlxM (UPF0122 family)